MGRRRRRVFRVVRRTLPKVFSCPRCGMISVKVSLRERTASIACGSCGLNSERETHSRKEAIDIYNEFVDEFLAGEFGS